MLMTYEAEGVYRRLLDHQSLHGGLPLDPNEIARLVPKVAAPRFLQKLWPAMAGKFPEVAGRRVNGRMARAQRELAEFIDRSVVGGRNSAEARRLKYGSAQPKRAEGLRAGSAEINAEASTERQPNGPEPSSSTSSSSSKKKEHTALVERWFDRFWDVYPRKEAKKPARRAFERCNPDVGLLERMLSALGRQVPVWAAEDFRYCPHPATWLHQERWNDAPAPGPRLRGSDPAAGVPVWNCVHVPRCGNRVTCAVVAMRTGGTV